MQPVDLKPLCTRAARLARATVAYPRRTVAGLRGFPPDPLQQKAPERDSHDGGRHRDTMSPVTCPQRMTSFVVQAGKGRAQNSDNPQASITSTTATPASTGANSVPTLCITMRPGRVR